MAGGGAGGSGETDDSAAPAQVTGSAVPEVGGAADAESGAAA